MADWYRIRKKEDRPDAHWGDVEPIGEVLGLKPSAGEEIPETVRDGETWGAMNRRLIHDKLGSEAHTKPWRSVICAIEPDPRLVRRYRLWFSTSLDARPEDHQPATPPDLSGRLS